MSSEIVKDQVEILVKRTTKMVEKLVEIEHRPYTLNTHYLDSNRAKRLACLKETRLVHTRPTSGPEPLSSSSNTISEATRQSHVDSILSNLAAIGQAGIKAEDLAKLNPTDEYEIELELMAQTCAYWKVAYKVSLVFLRDLTNDTADR